MVSGRRYVMPNEAKEDLRFEFGENWARYLAIVSQERIEEAVISTQKLLGQDLHGKTLIDIGSGSGLFSLVARKLGTTVHSFDFDLHSVACTTELKRRFFPGDTTWQI